jgi:cell wall-associated NlpC family hydrolase
VRARALMCISTFALCLSMGVSSAAYAQDPAPGGAAPEPQPDQQQPAPQPGPGTGGSEYGVQNPAAHQTVPGLKAKIVNGMAAAPDLAPQAIQEAIWAANDLIGKPYRWGGGHRTWDDTGYDCSGTVSYALHGANLLTSPLDSSSFMSWGTSGKGQWVTVYTNPGHAFAVIAGLRLDTSAANDPSGAKGPRWRPRLRSTRGFRARHPLSF